MRIGKVTLAAAALAAASAPIAGQAVAADRAASPIGGENEVGGGGATIAIVFFLAVFVAGIFLADGDDTPASP
jgi:hypothetical protein